MTKNDPIVMEHSVHRPGSRYQLGMLFFIPGVLVVISVVAYFIFMPKNDVYLLKLYTYTVVKPAAIKDTLLCTGNIEIRHPELLLAPADGVVDYLGVTSGVKVKPGQLLVKIKPKTLEDELFESTNNLIKSKRELEQLTIEQQIVVERHSMQLTDLQNDLTDANMEYQKIQQLYSAGACSLDEVRIKQKVVNKAKTAVATLQKELDMNTIQYQFNTKNLTQDIQLLDWKISQLKAELSACQMVSPIDGQVMECFVDTGSYVVQRARVLTLVNPSQAVVVLKVPDDKINKITVGQMVEVTFAKKRYPGRVVRIAAQVQNNQADVNANVDVEVEFQKQPKQVVSGGTVIAEIVLGLKKAALCLPRGPYLTTGGQVCVYRLDQRHHTARKVAVTFGIVNSSKAEILSGLQAGDQVIFSSYQDYLNRQEINVNPQGGTKND